MNDLDSLALGIYRDALTGTHLFSAPRIAAMADRLGMEGRLLAEALVQEAIRAEDEEKCASS